MFLNKIRIFSICMAKTSPQNETTIMLKCNVSWFRFPRILNFTRKRHETMWYEGNVCFSCRFVETRKTLYLRLYFVSLFFAVDVSKLWSSTWKVCAKNKLDVLPVKDIEEYFQNKVWSEKGWLRLNSRLSTWFSLYYNIVCEA